MIDTHSHIHGQEFNEDFPEMIQRARDAGVTRVVMIGVHPDDTDRALDVARLNPDYCRVVAGLHPHEAKDWNEAVKRRLKSQAESNRGRIVAIGEMGLDYHYDFAPKDTQKAAFRGQLDLARDLNLPIVIHCREAYDDCLDILRDFYGSDTAAVDGQPRGVVHCYFGSVEQAHECVRLGFMIGVGGACTFKKAEELHRVVSEISMEHFVLETDAPFMAPVPFRGKRNEPSYLTYVAARIAELKNSDVETVNRVTTENARRLYRWAD